MSDNNDAATSTSTTEEARQCNCVPYGWFVMNPKRVAELKSAERAVSRARELADKWASEPYAEEFASVLAGALIDALNGDLHE